MIIQQVSIALGIISLIGFFFSSGKQKKISAFLFGIAVIVGIISFSGTPPSTGVNPSTAEPRANGIPEQGSAIAVTGPGCITKTNVFYNCGNFDITLRDPNNSTPEENAAIDANWAPKDSIPLPQNAFELQENGIISLKRGRKDLCINYLGGTGGIDGEYSIPQSVTIGGSRYSAAGTRCFPLPESLEGQIAVSSSHFERRMPGNRLYKGPPLNSYEINQKLGTGTVLYTAYPFVNYGD